MASRDGAVDAMTILIARAPHSHVIQGQKCTFLLRIPPITTTATVDKNATTVLFAVGNPSVSHSRVDHR